MLRSWRPWRFHTVGGRGNFVGLRPAGVAGDGRFTPVRFLPGSGGLLPERHRLASICRTVALAVLAAGCDGDGGASHSSPPPCAVGDCGRQAVGEWVFASSANVDLDVLFVVDTTDAGRELQRQVADELPGALAALALAAHGFPWLHFGVVAAGDGRGPACAGVAPAPSCGVARGYGFLATGPCGAYTAHPEHPKDIAGCLVDLPDASCDAGDPLDVLARALADPAAAGLTGPTSFLRPSAYLMIVVVSAMAEDAPGATAVAEVAAAIARAKSAAGGDADDVVAIVAGACGADRRAPPALSPRLRAFADGAPAGLGAAIALCPGNLTSLLGGGLLGGWEGGGPACLDRVKDVDARRAGLQPDCLVEERTGADGDGPVVVRTLRACADGAEPPCWRLADTKACGGRGRELQIEREPGFCPAIATSTRVFCTTCASASDPGCAP